MLDETELAHIKLIVFDVDGVLVPRGTKIRQSGNITTLETKKILRKQIDQIRQLHDLGFMINISSGRSLTMLQEMFREILEYVSITYENGSATWFRGQIHQHINSFDKLNDVHKELQMISDPKIKGFEPKEFIITIHATDRVDDVEFIMAKHTPLYSIWNGEAYDIGINWDQTKGVGLKRLTTFLGLKRSDVLAIGDNYNDIELLAEAGVAISADRTRVSGDFCVPLDQKILPADALMSQIISKMQTKHVRVKEAKKETMIGT
ncbi:hypothetical protein COT47_02920 [Candidatus Woesearchaeota archaeon CG08_land_8_20_14_0_20_43_7]|nr:MAG: hypothetical protein COT47_02920 [Candidatus Woesearchaeota archaeon CG08_land_8_20_14_0_20_43_7]